MKYFQIGKTSTSNTLYWQSMLGQTGRKKQYSKRL